MPTTEPVETHEIPEHDEAAIWDKVTARCFAMVKQYGNSEDRLINVCQHGAMDLHTLLFSSKRTPEGKEYWIAEAKGTLIDRVLTLISQETQMSDPLITNDATWRERVQRAHEQIRAGLLPRPSNGNSDPFTYLAWEARFLDLISWIHPAARDIALHGKDSTQYSDAVDDEILEIIRCAIPTAMDDVLRNEHRYTTAHDALSTLRRRYGNADSVACSEVIRRMAAWQQGSHSGRQYLDEMSVMRSKLSHSHPLSEEIYLVLLRSGIRDQTLRVQLERADLRTVTEKLELSPADPNYTSFRTRGQPSRT